MSWADCGEICVVMRCGKWCGHPCQEKKCETNQQKNCNQKPSKITDLFWSQWWDQHHGERPTAPLWPPYCKPSGFLTKTIWNIYLVFFLFKFTLIMFSYLLNYLPTNMACNFFFIFFLPEKYIFKRTKPVILNKRVAAHFWNASICLLWFFLLMLFPFIEQILSFSISNSIF